jgi:hypothetical protein
MKTTITELRLCIQALESENYVLHAQIKVVVFDASMTESVSTKGGVGVNYILIIRYRAMLNVDNQV